MHMISKKDLSNAEMDTLTKSCSLTIVVTANGEVQTHGEAIVYVKELDIFLTMKVLDNTPAVLSRNQFSQVQHRSDDRRKACSAAGGVSKRRYLYCSDNSGRILYLGALQGHSGSNLIDRTLQDNVVIGSGIFHFIYHVGCAFNLHSIINNGLILGGQNSSKRQTGFFLPIDPRDKNQKDPEKIDMSVPRRA